MSCEYRVVRRSRLNYDGDLEVWLEIMGVRYHLGRQYRIYLTGATIENLRDDLAAYVAAFDKPVLEERDGKLVEVEE